MATTQNNGVIFEMYRGDDKSFRVDIVDDSGNGVDITGWAFKCTMKKNLSESDDQALVKVDIPALSDTNATLGVLALVLPHEQTTNLTAGLYYIDIQMELNGYFSTVMHGKCRVHADVTQRVV